MIEQLLFFEESITVPESKRPDPLRSSLGVPEKTASTDIHAILPQTPFLNNRDFSVSGFLKLPRSLLDDPLWIETPPAQKDVFLTILKLTPYHHRLFDDFGHMIELKAGQICISIREIKEKCGKWITKNQVEDALARFSRYQLWRQERRHVRTIITFCDSILSECFKNGEETTFQTDRGHFADTTKDLKKERLKEEKQEATTSPKKSKSKSRKSGGGIFFNRENRKFDNITAEFFALLEETYEGVNVLQEMKEMVLWLMANPDRDGTQGFITNWLKKALKNVPKPLPVEEEKPLEVDPELVKLMNKRDEEIKKEMESRENERRDYGAVEESESAV